jgi:hypothetical protein
MDKQSEQRPTPDTDAVRDAFKDRDAEIEEAAEEEPGEEEPDEEKPEPG